MTGPRKGSAGKNRKFFPAGWTSTNGLNGTTKSPARGGWMTNDEQKQLKTQTNYQNFEERVQVSHFRKYTHQTSRKLGPYYIFKSENSLIAQNGDGNNLTSSLPASFFKKHLPQSTHLSFITSQNYI